jgi:hypothetical protein
MGQNMLQPQVFFLCSIILTFYLALFQPATAQITAPWEGKILFFVTAIFHAFEFLSSYIIVKLTVSKITPSTLQLMLSRLSGAA